MPLRTSWIDRPSLVGRKPMRKKKIKLLLHLKKNKNFKDDSNVYTGDSFCGELTHNNS